MGRFENAVSHYSTKTLRTNSWFVFSVYMPLDAHETPHHRSSPQLAGDEKHAQVLYVLSLYGA